MDFKKSDEIGNLAASLAAAQGEIAGAKKTSNNPHFRSKYADLSEIWEACRKPLADHGLAVMQMPGALDGGVSLTTLIAHESGQWVSQEAQQLFADSNNPQKVAAAITYMRKSGLAGFVGISQVDDDGNSISPAPGGEKQQSKQDADQLPPYPKTEMAANQKKWEGLISSGKRSAMQIINAISTQYTLTPTQVSLIRSLEGLAPPQ